jgi:toxin YoeB
VKKTFTDRGWDEYEKVFADDKKRTAKINALIKDIDRHPFTGLGKPEPLKNELSGWWSRRINDEHRLVYRVEGTAEEQRMVILSCEYHYDS